MAKHRQAQHPRHLGRRHRALEPELLHARADGLPDAQHRPHRQGRHAVHRQLRRAVLHRRPLVVHHRPERATAPACRRSAFPAAPIGMNDKIVTIAALLKNQGYATGQFGKNHLGDLNHMLPTNHGFDEFFGNLYHLNAEEEPEMDDYPPEKDFPNFQQELRPARRDPFLGDRQGRPDRAAALGQGRQAEDRGHRPADQEADGDLRRRVRRRGQGLHQARRTRPASRSSCGSTPPTCTCSRTPRRRAWARPAAGSRPITTR